MVNIQQHLPANPATETLRINECPLDALADACGIALYCREPRIDNACL